MAALQRQEGMSSAIGVRLLYCEMERPGNLPSNPSKQHYMMQAQRKPLRLGRRPAKQGPRPLSSNQGRVEKSVTDDEENKDRRILSQGHAKQLQLRNKFRPGTRNIRSMLCSLVQLLDEEMMKLGVDIPGLSEVRWDG